MSNLSRIALAVAGLVLGLTIGLMAGEPQVAGATLGTVERMVIPASEFHPMTSGQVWTNTGSELYGEGAFRAGFNFPYPMVKVLSITLYYYDNYPSDIFCTAVYRIQPAIGERTKLGNGCSETDSGSPRSLEIIPTPPWFLAIRHAGDIEIGFGLSNSELRFLGALVTYRPVQ